MGRHDRLESGHAGSGHKPREPRRKVMMRVDVDWDSGRCAACIRDISRRGLLLVANEAPRRGTIVEVSSGNHVIVGEVVWSKGRRFGVKSSDFLNVLAIISNHPVPTSAPRSPRVAAPSGARRSADSNRSMGKALQFAVLVAIGAGAAVAAATAVYEIVAPTLLSVSSALK